MRTALVFLLISFSLVKLTASRRSNSFCRRDKDCKRNQLCRPIYPDCDVPKKCMCAQCFTEENGICVQEQSEAEQRSGTSFHTGFMFSLETTFGDLDLYIQSPSANIKITVPFLSIFDEPHVVTTSKVITFSEDLTVASVGIPTNKTIHIESDNPISVYWLNYKNYSADAGRLLSDEELGQEYIVSGARSPISKREVDQILLVSLNDGTCITVEYPNDPTETILLDSMEAYRLTGDELSGTIITSNEPIAVKSGHECYENDSERCDLMSEQIPPVSSLGLVHITGYMKPFLRSYLKVLAPFDNTDVSIYDMNGNLLDGPIGLSRGDTFDKAYSNLALSVISTKKVLVVQYGDDFEFSPVRDSSKMQILSIDNYVSVYDFYVPADYEQAILEIVIASTCNPDGLLLDGLPLIVTETVSATVPGSGMYSIIYSNINSGHHILSHVDNNDFTAYLFARRQRSEYALVL